MTVSPSFDVANWLLELDGQLAGQLAAADTGSMMAATAPLPAVGNPLGPKAVRNVQYGDCTIVTGVSDDQDQLDWVSSLWRQDLVEKEGAIILADMNFQERFRSTFRGAYVTGLTLDVLDAGHTKTPYRMTYTFAPETLKYEVGSGRAIQRIPGMKRSWNSANFRIQIGSLPCERVTRVSGLSVTSEIGRGQNGGRRLPVHSRGNVKYGDMTVEISVDERTFSEWTTFASQTLQDGVVSESEALTSVIEWLDPTQKTTLGTLHLGGCAIKEFKFGPKLEDTKSGRLTCTAVFAVEQFELKVNKA